MTPDNVDLFGSPFVEPMRADQLPLFHEPVTLPPPVFGTAEDRRMARKFANCPTGDLFHAAPTDRD